MNLFLTLKTTVSSMERYVVTFGAGRLGNQVNKTNSQQRKLFLQLYTKCVKFVHFRFVLKLSNLTFSHGWNCRTVT